METLAVTQPSHAGQQARGIPGGTTAGEVEYGPLDAWIGFHLRLAQAASFHAFALEASDVDLSPGRFATLMLIGNNPGISQTALSRANARDKSSLTPVLDDLERRRLIRRTRARSDRRSYRLTLTPAGEELLERLMVCAQRHERRLDEIIGPRERARFLQSLKKLVAELPGNGNGNGHA
jgi:DNA-binding MarR family transcriptional regulator